MPLPALGLAAGAAALGGLATLPGRAHFVPIDEPETELERAGREAFTDAERQPAHPETPADGGTTAAARRL